MIASPIVSLVLAQSAGGGASSGGLFGNPLIFMVLMFVMMYFIIIRPQRLKQRQHDELLKQLKVGDHVVTAGGEHGIIASLKDTTVMVKVADNVRIEYERSAVTTVKKKSEEPAEASA